MDRARIKTLSSIRFIWLTMAEEYIEDHFGEIVGHESEIEKRLADGDYERAIEGLLQEAWNMTDDASR